MTWMSAGRGPLEPGGALLGSIEPILDGRRDNSNFLSFFFLFFVFFCSNSSDSPKPPVAPKPRTSSPRVPGVAPPLAASPHLRLRSPHRAPRGPKPPIAPKPRLADPGDCRPGVCVGDSVTKCRNGRLLCVDPGLDQGRESETDEDDIEVPRAVARDMENVAPEEPPGDPGDEEQEDGGQDTGAGEDPAEGTPSGEGEGHAGDIPENGEEDCEDAPGTEEQGSTSEEEEKRVKVHNAYNLGARGPWDTGDISEDEIILTHVDAEAPEVPCEEPEAPGEEEAQEDGEEDPFGAEPGGLHEVGDPDGAAQDTGQDAADDSEETREGEELGTAIQGTETATDSLETPEGHEEQEEDGEVEEEGEGGPDGRDQEDPGDQEEAPDQGERAAEEGPLEGEDPALDEPMEPPMQDEATEDSCQIVPFESDSLDDFVTSLTGSPYAFLPTESTSFCSDSYSQVPEPGQEPGTEGQCAEDAPQLPGDAGEGPSIPDVVVVPEDEDAPDDSLSNPYVVAVGLPSPGDPGGGGQSETPATPDGTSGPDGTEEMSSAAEGSLVPSDRKGLATRARPHSGKVAGYVPETVLEEAGPEAGPPGSGTAGAAEEAHTPLDGRPPEGSRALPAKPRAFTLYPRSFSVEGREVPVGLFREPDGPGLDDLRIQSKDDTLSLPCVIGSSGSFSQRNHLPSSGTSTPSSVVDIPPPFDLACITKRPITKSSPSLLLDSESPDKATKKKKSSFKRFLALTFKKKSESKGHGDLSVSSSRSSSESSYHGPPRLLDLDRRSFGNSPQLKSRAGKLRASESPSSLIFYRDGKRKGIPPSRTVSRVESFEDRSRPPFLPLPLTKPRSISFPNADTSDYENIPAGNSDYENIQIPPRRPARAGTFTKLFEEQSRALSTANENDGYVDMSSFNAFENRQQSAEQEAESTYTEPYKVCPISVVAPKEDLTSDEEQGSSEEEDSAPRDPSLTHKGEGQSRALVVAQELLASEKAYVQALQHLRRDFHGAVLRALDDMDQEGRDALAREELRRGLSELPAIHDLHQGILEELEDRLSNWEGQQKVADVFLAREQEFDHHAAHILQFDRYLALLAENCLLSPRLAAAVREFEQGQHGGGQSAKHRLLRVVQRLFQYQVLLTDYLNNLRPDSAEYDDTQGALSLISKVTDRANDSMEQGENLQKLVHIDHSVRGQGDLLQPGREFLKEGTLAKVRGKSRHPRHLFLMSDVLLYTYPQKDGKYRLKSSLAVANMKVSRPVMEKVPYALKIEVPECCLCCPPARTLHTGAVGGGGPWNPFISHEVAAHHAHTKHPVPPSQGVRPASSGSGFLRGPEGREVEAAAAPLTEAAARSSCAERDEWYSCLSRALPEDYKAQALAAFHHSVEIRERLGVSLGERPPTLVPVTHVMMCMNCGCDFSLTLRRHHCHACGKIVCRNCSRNKYPLRYLKDRLAKVCDGCYGELKRRGGAVPGPMRERPVSMSFPLTSARFSSGSALSAVFPSTFKKQKKVPSALTEVAASGEGSAISGYLSRCKRGKRHWKKLWFVIKGKVLYTYVASEDKVALESMPLLGFTIAPEKEEGGGQAGPVFHLYHKKTLFYSFKAESAGAAQRWMQAMEDASVL
ncbi:FYVE, RhoGEF and PH domain-containing protein 5 [Marmota marmota marmota]|uniref:FYVE, RhoGEF and PH domain-containing protein 5 n=1 Tax=Marmota marmota marmota TaxID=9994 RepID=UPI002093D80F|nr:FYVE, RhoGEF and PH domain-containing protein 5 [Marmota marmota marmota]